MKKEDATPITPANHPAPAPVAPTPASTGQPAAPTPYREDPGQTLGIIGIVLNIMGITPGGIVLGILSRNKSREAGFPTTLGTISMVWGIVATALGLLLLLAWLALMIFAVAFSADDYEPTTSPNEGNYSDSSSI